MCTLFELDLLLDVLRHDAPPFMTTSILLALKLVPSMSVSVYSYSNIVKTIWIDDNDSIRTFLSNSLIKFRMESIESIKINHFCDNKKKIMFLIYWPLKCVLFHFKRQHDYEPNGNAHIRNNSDWINEYNKHDWHSIV